MKKKIFLLSFVILLISVLVFIPTCSKKKSETPEKKVIKIGAILPLTGPLAFLGEPERNALELAFEELKKENYNVKLIIEDSKGNAKDGITSAQKLVMEGVKAIIVSTTGISKAVLPIAKRNKIIIFTQCMAPGITGESKYAFRIFPSYREEQKLIVEYIKAKGFKNVFLYYANSAGIKPEADIFKEFISNNENIKLIGEQTFEMKQTDFKETLTKIKNLNPEVLVILGYGQSYPLILKQIHEMQLNTQIIGNVALEQAGATKYGTNIFEGVIFPSFSVAQMNENILALREKYYKAFGKYPGGFLDYPYFYDSLKIIVKAIDDADGDIEKAVQLMKTMEFIGVNGKIRFSDTGDANPPLALATYKEGKVVPLNK